MAMVSLGFILINKLFCFISAGCLLLAMRQHGRILLWSASLLGAMGKSMSRSGCESHLLRQLPFLYDLGWDGVYGIAFCSFTALMLTCAAIILINMIMALEAILCRMAALTRLIQPTFEECSMSGTGLDNIFLIQFM